MNELKAEYLSFLLNQVYVRVRSQPVYEITCARWVLRFTHGHVLWFVGFVGPTPSSSLEVRVSGHATMFTTHYVMMSLARRRHRLSEHTCVFSPLLIWSILLYTVMDCLHTSVLRSIYVLLNKHMIWPCASLTLSDCMGW